MRIGTIIAALTIAAALFSGASLGHADDLTDRAKAGKPIRIGFAHEIPWAYPGDKNEPLGFANALALGVLKSMAYTNIEPVVADWGGLIPGLQAGRFDMITGGMYITGKRCANVNFVEPMGKFGGSFIVKKGNPKHIQTYQDMKKNDATMAPVSGFVNADAALKEGIAEDKVMQVPGLTEVLAAVKPCRADADAGNDFAMKELVKSTPDDLEVTDSAVLPEWTFNWVDIAFKPDDKDFLKAYDEAQAKYLGTQEMLEAVGKCQYRKAEFPGDTNTDWICANR